VNDYWLLKGSASWSWLVANQGREEKRRKTGRIDFILKGVFIITKRYV